MAEVGLDFDLSSNLLLNLALLQLGFVKDLESTDELLRALSS